MKKIILSILLFFCFLSKNYGIEFEYYGAPKNIECFGEEVNENTILAGEVRSTSSSISVKLYDPNGKMLFAKANETISKFSTTSQTTGTFQVCIENLSRKFINYVVKVNTGVFAKDYSEMVKTKNLKPIEIILKKIEDSLKEIQKSTNYFIQKKEEMIDNLDFVNSKIMIFSIVTIISLVILGIFQSYYLKKFFKSKKLI